MPVSGAQTWLVVPGLEPGTEYQFSVLAQNKLGTGPFSEVVTVNTAGGYLTRGFSIHVYCFLTSELAHPVETLEFIGYHQTYRRCCPLVFFELLYTRV